MEFHKRFFSHHNNFQEFWSLHYSAKTLDNFFLLKKNHNRLTNIGVGVVKQKVTLHYKGGGGYGQKLIIGSAL